MQRTCALKTNQYKVVTILDYATYFTKLSFKSTNLVKKSIDNVFEHFSDNLDVLNIAVNNRRLMKMYIKCFTKIESTANKIYDSPSRRMYRPCTSKYITIQLYFCSTITFAPYWMLREKHTAKSNSLKC